MTPEEIEEFKNWGAKLPSREAHGTPEELRASLEEAQCRNWRLEGNKLVADTQFGPLAQFIPTNFILTGTDELGLPVFKALEL